MELPKTQSKSWYLVEGAGNRQWFDKSPLETVLGMAILMTGMGMLSGANEVTVEDSKKQPVVTFVANEKHQGCRIVIPVGSSTTLEDLSLLNHFMCAYKLIKGSIA